MSSFASQIVAVAAITRPINCALTMVSVVVGALTMGASRIGVDVGLAAVAAALITGSGNVINDLTDVEEDRINRPDRPLPSGAISPVTAWVSVVILGLTGLGMAWELGPATGMIATAVAIGLIAYSLGLKHQGPIGNLLVAAMAALTFPYGAMAVADGVAAGGAATGMTNSELAWNLMNDLFTVGRAWIPASFAFVYHLGREIVKGVEDQAGDERRGVGTLAIRFGPIPARRMAAVCLILVGLVALAPWIAGVYGIAYGVSVLILDAMLVGWIRLLLTSVPIGRLSRRLLAGMALGLLAICLGELTAPAPAHSPPVQDQR